VASASNAQRQAGGDPQRFAAALLKPSLSVDEMKATTGGDPQRFAAALLKHRNQCQAIRRIDVIRSDSLRPY